jgi:hypothetical protein
LVRTFVEVLEEICDDCNSEDDVNENVTIKFVDQFWNVGGDPTIILSEAPEVNASTVIYRSLKAQRTGESIDTYVPFAAAAIFSSEVVPTVGHELLYFCLENRIIGGEFSVNDLVNLVNRQLGMYLNKPSFWIRTC